MYRLIILLQLNQMEYNMDLAGLCRLFIAVNKCYTLDDFYGLFYTNRDLKEKRFVMWCLPNDSSKAVITAAEQINSAHRECHLHLPETAVVFFMSKGTDYLIEHYDTEETTEPFPRFLNRCPIWKITDLNLCFLDGGRGGSASCRYS